MLKNVIIVINNRNEAGHPVACKNLCPLILECFKDAVETWEWLN